MFEYDPAAKAAAERLNDYDFTETLSKCYDLGRRNTYDLQEAISEAYPDAEEYLAELSTDEFMEYLCVNYHVRFEEVVNYRMWYNPHYR